MDQLGPLYKFCKLKNKNQNKNNRCDENESNILLPNYSDSRVRHKRDRTLRDRCSAHLELHAFRYNSMHLCQKTQVIRIFGDEDRNAQIADHFAQVRYFLDNPDTEARRRYDDGEESGLMHSVKLIIAHSISCRHSHSGHQSYGSRLGTLKAH